LPDQAQVARMRRIPVFKEASSANTMPPALETLFLGAVANLDALKATKST
jgi:hypothetical protein